MLIERVRRALAPDYEILEEIAGGGMGVVFAARQGRLDRKVAIKILRPEHATAVAAERFLAEGRVLARLAHPSIVPVYDAGEADGLLYYVMEYVEGETLADRLLRGPLSLAEAMRLAEDLLGALSAAHALGVVHRDVKPANIFLRDGRALLGDFGVARWREKDETGYTTPGQMIGTPRYMSPEQRDGLPATSRTDVYSAALVLYEACVGQRWPHYQEPANADWSRVPPRLARPVQHALELEPEERWSGASEFAAALRESKRQIPRAWVASAGLLVLAVGIAYLLGRGGPNCGLDLRPSALTINVTRFAGSGDRNAASLGDSVSRVLARTLGGYPDFHVPPLGCRAGPESAQVGGSVSSSGDSIAIVARWTSAAGIAAALPRQEGLRADLARVADALALDLVGEIWQSEAGGDRYLPRAALPTSSGGKALGLLAEQFLAQARWDEADSAYAAAERQDSTCLLCAYRRLDIDRWLFRNRDTARIARLNRNIDSFPPHYRSLIRAAGTLLPARLDTLREAYGGNKGFFLTSFEYGDELFHRGALYGHLRSDALEPFQRTVQLRPRFGPAWEHLLWLYLSEGDSTSASGALDSLTALPPGTGFSSAFRTLLTVGYHWRFLPVGTARSFTQQVLENPGIKSNPEAVAGARLLMTMDEPRGAVEVGGMLSRWSGRPDAVREGLLGQLFGYAALGRMDSLRATSGRLGQLISDPGLPLLALELEAVLRAFDPDPGVRAAPDLAAKLEEYLARGARAPELRRRAAWALGIFAIRSGDRTRERAARLALADAPASDTLRRILEAAATGALGDPARALGSLPKFPGIDASLEYNDDTLLEYDDPLEEAVVRLLRADWLERSGEHDAALKMLRWHEHLDGFGHGSGDPHPGEMAWALGTLVRWQRAAVLEKVGRGGAEQCSVYRGVARLWATGEPVFVARADSAGRARKALGCPGLP